VGGGETSPYTNLSEKGRDARKDGGLVWIGMERGDRGKGGPTHVREEKGGCLSHQILFRHAICAMAVPGKRRGKDA